MNKYLKQLKQGIVDQNPTFVQFLGMCPTLAVTTSVSNAIGMGLAATAVLICSNVLISLLRKFIPKEIRIASYIVIISGFVTAVELLMHAYLQSLYASLGLYIPLIVVNCIILARAEAFASKNPVLPSAIDGLAMGLGFTCSLTVIGSVREILGAGTWLGLPILGSHYKPAIIFILPAGAFLTLGMLAAVVNALRQYAAAHPRQVIEAIPQETVDALIPDSDVAAPAEEAPVNTPSSELAMAELKAAEKMLQDTLNMEKPEDKAPAAEAVKAEASAAEAAAAPAAETSAKETPVAEAPAAETSATEAAAAETPAAETSAPEAPAVETPAAETSAPEAPAAETPVTEVPVETPAAETPAEETPAEESKDTAKEEPTA